MSVWAVVVAAGGGERFGGPKQFAMIGGRKMVCLAVDCAKEVVDGVVLVLPADRVGQGELLSGGAAAPTPAEAATPALSPGDRYGADIVVAGGPTRSDSVRAAIASLPQDADIVVVHDGARPLADPNLFRTVIEAVRGGSDGAVPAVALSDTLKEVKEGLVAHTVDRNGLVSVQTPQAFRADVLKRAHATGAQATDDSGLVEAIGGSVRVVPGDPRNIKVTTVFDLEIVQALARTQ